VTRRSWLDSQPVIKNYIFNNLHLQGIFCKSLAFIRHTSGGYDTISNADIREATTDGAGKNSVRGSKMVAKYLRLFKKWVYVALSLLTSPALFTIVFMVGCATEPSSVLTSQSKEYGANQAPADANKSKAAEEKKAARPGHTHSAFAERIKEREEMVAVQIQARDVKDANVLTAMRIVPRHAFVPDSVQRYAYGDHPLPIGFDQTISQPYIVAFMTEALELKPDSKVLEIGTGSGYQAAVCAEIAAEVYTIEIVEGLAKSAEEKLKELGYPNVFVRAGDGYFGWPEKAPFDAIIGTAAAGRIPPPLIEQLKPGGRMILPYETNAGFQYLVLITKDEKGNLSRKNVMPVMFVPMTGEVTKPEKSAK
jgi:protein-L-isoaspartate(D-aspartate) O-methyltransferase